MNYATHYSRLIERAKQRELSGYCERHHILPRCVGGGNAKSNLVNLTAEEHFVAHLLLMKMYPENWGLLTSVMRLSEGATNNKLYGWLRRRFAAARSAKQVSDDTRQKQRLAKLGTTRNPHSAETKAKMSAALKGRLKTAAHRAALAKAKLGTVGNNTGKRWSEDKRMRHKAIMTQIKARHRSATIGG